MMKRGPLADYPLDGVLRTAAAEGVSGTLEIDAAVYGLFALESGEVTYAVLGGAQTPVELCAAAAPSAEEVHAHIRAVAAALVPQRSGWYHYYSPHQPVGSIPQERRGQYPVDQLLEDVAALTNRSAALGPWAAALVATRPHATEAPLDPDAWAVLAAMAQPVSVHVLADRLGWDDHRLAHVLGRMAARHLLAPTLGGSASAAAVPLSQSWDGEVDLRLRSIGAPRAARGLRAAEPALAAGAAPAWRGPAGAANGNRRRSALGRLISSLRA